MNKLKDAVISLEKERIIAALEVNQGHVSNAAKQLGLSLQGTYNKIRRYKLEHLVSHESQFMSVRYRSMRAVIQKWFEELDDVKRRLTILEKK